MRCSRWFVTGCGLPFMLLISIPAAAQVCEDTTLPLQCNGTINNGTALLKVTAKDADPVNSGPQNVTGQVCDAGTLDDRFTLAVFRLSSPKDVSRCITDPGSEIPCGRFPAPKGNNAKSDTFYFLIDTHTVGTTIEQPGAGIEFQATGWDTLKVEVVDSFVATVFLNVGLGCPAA